MSAHYTENARQPDSYYRASRRYELSCPALLEDMDADVCVIGGGYTGLSCALELANSGCQVALLEAQQIAWGASGRNGGHVGVGQRRTQEALQGLYGTEVAGKLWQCGLDAVDLVKTLITKHQIDCDLQSGILHVAHKRRYTEALAAEAEYLQRHHGYREATAVSEEEVAELLGSRAFYGGMKDSGSMHLHPLNYALGLAKAVLDAGVRVFEESPVT
ncbi:MAG: FAD-binding oxidoreductase, partial [Gammaproteobacteria bacterium]